MRMSGIMNRHIFLTGIVVFIWLNEFVTETKCADLSDHMIKMQTVKNKIFKDYDKTIRPVIGESNTTEVYTSLMPRQVIGLDEETAMFTLDSFLYLGWVDPRLRWNETDYNGYLQIPQSMVWVPDITIHNSHSAQIDPTQQVLLYIHSSGGVHWFPPVLTQTSCPSVSQASYPRDEVECLVKFGSWSHDGWEIDFLHEDILQLDEFENVNPRWEMLTSKARIYRNVTIYECCPEPYISIVAHFPMKRRPVPEIEATRTPCILVMLLTLSIFWLPTNSSKKVLLGGILFLILNMLLVYVAWSTKYPLAVLLAVSFLQTTMYLVVVALLLQVLVITKICSLRGPFRPPPGIMRILTGPFGKYACLRSPFSEDNVPLDRIQLKDEEGDNSPSPNDEWVLFAAAMDRVFFVIMSIVMVAVHHL